MDYNERAKKSPYNIENEITTFKEKTEEKWELRKKHNQNIIMAQRKKRIAQLSQTIIQNNIDNIENGSNLENKDSIKPNEIEDKLLLKEQNLSLKFPPLNKISDNINLVLKYLSSDNREENRWIIWALRVFFENNNIPYNEYLILFDNNIHKYYENLLNKYVEDYILINEIFYTIANFFCSSEIVNKYPKNYLEYFLSDNYFLIYQKYIMMQENELIASILILLINILWGNYDLIKKIYFNRKEFFYNLLEFFHDKQINIEFVKNFIKFFSLIFNAIKNNYITDVKLFLLILDVILMTYRNINLEKNIDINLIILILSIFGNALTCKVKDENENDDYFVINFLFNGNNIKSYKFVSYFCNVLKESKFYFNNQFLLIKSLEILYCISYYSTKYQNEQLIEYGLLNILNNIICIKDNRQNEIIEKLLSISNNIIDSDLESAKIYVNSQIFENLVQFFSLNMANNKIMDLYLNTFQRVLNYNDKDIAENLYKRGIIKDAIFNSLQYSNENQNEKRLVLKKCKIIISYLNTMYDFHLENNESFDKEEYLLCYKFKEILLNGSLNLSEGIIEALIHTGCMNSIENKA